MENSIIVPFDLNTARKIKSGEIEGSVLIDNIEIEFVYESKDCAGPAQELANVNVALTDHMIY